MRYVRMPIEIEAPEEYGYAKFTCSSTKPIESYGWTSRAALLSGLDAISKALRG